MVSLTDQTVDQDRNGGHFLFSPYSHSDREELPRTYGEDSNATGEKIYAKRGDVILWRSDLVHAIVAPSLTQNGDNSVNVDHDSNELFGYSPHSSDQHQKRHIVRFVVIVPERTLEIPPARRNSRGQSTPQMPPGQAGGGRAGASRPHRNDHFLQKD